jgi:cytochrome c biogenesis protein CcmG/thiol:disulfide interchange protein DsbE
MRTSLIIIALLVLAGAAFTFLPKTPGSAAPSFSFETLDGEKHELSDFKGKTILLNFWASWCPPCVEEFPKLINLANEHGDDVVLIALSSDSEDATIEHFLHQHDFASKANILIARDKNDVTLKVFGISQLPETLVIDHDLRIHAKFIGAEWKIDELEAAISDIEKGK